jgi:hypothetical protein
MICHDCHAPDADCLAAVDGARLCETCLYERTLARLEEAQGEVRRLRAELDDIRGAYRHAATEIMRVLDVRESSGWLGAALATAQLLRIDCEAAEAENELLKARLAEMDRYSADAVAAAARRAKRARGKA